MQSIIRSTLIACAAIFSHTAFAQNYGNQSYGNQSYGNTGGFDFARVISAQPIYETVEIDDGREVCRNEQVHTPRYSDNYRGQRSESGSIMGAIIGGVIGNQFGRGRGRTAATVAGAALGSAVVRDAERQDGYRGRYDSRRSVVTTERVCTIEPRYRTERQIVGYNVRYDYKGQVGETTTRNQPGSTIRVRVDVEAIED
jgi:uncharacterized protein YcfJ